MLTVIGYGLSAAGAEADAPVLASETVVTWSPLKRGVVVNSVPAKISSCPKTLVASFARIVSGAGFTASAPGA